VLFGEFEKFDRGGMGELSQKLADSEKNDYS